MANEDYTFVFRKSKYFWKFVNRQFLLANPNDIFEKLGEEGDYTFILCSKVPSDLNTCIDPDNGCLITDAEGLDIIDLQEVYSNISADVPMPYFRLKYTPIQDGEAGFTLTLDSGATDIQIQLGDSQIQYLEGIFLVKREASETHHSNFVMAHSRIGSPINVRNFINIPFDGLIFGVGYCAYQG